MKHRYPMIRYGKKLLSMVIGLPLFMLALSFLPGAENGRIVVWAMAIMMTIIFVVTLRKAIAMAFIVIELDEDGISAKCLGRKLAYISWENCKRIVIREYQATVSIYDQCWLCFCNGSFVPDAKCSKGLFSVPLPSEDCIYMVYSEFVWDIIKANAHKRSYSSTLLESERII